VAELGEITPLIADVAFADGYAPDSEISMEVFAAELQRMLAEDFAAEASGEGDATPAKKAPHPWPAVARCSQAGDCHPLRQPVPNEANVPNKRPVAEVGEHMIRHLQITAIKRKADGSYSAASSVLRAAGRK
jgi:hypothetical protein